MSKIPCLHRCGNVWYFRRRVPSELRAIVGKTEIWKSLHTKDYGTALQRHQTISGDVAIMFNKLRQQHADGAYNDDLDRDILLHKTSTHPTQIKVPPPSDQDGLRTLIKTVVEEILGTDLKPPAPSITIKELYHRYMNDPAAVRSPKTVMTYQSVYNALVELFGEERQINTISRDDCRRVLEIIRYLPANAKKKFPKKTLVQASEAARKQGMKAMAPLTINKYLSKLSAMLNWAVDEELLDRNPAKNLSVADPVRKQDKRLPFSDHQLRKIFTALEALPHRGSQYFISYIGLLNGMRLNEICQLNVEDIQQHEGIWCFAITAESTLGQDDKRLKTKASERIIPIHPKLFELGFFQYLKRFENKPRAKLFPDISPGTTGYRSDTFSKQFIRFLKSIDATADKTSFYSFRHNFRDALREAGVRHEIAMLLGGWAEGSRSQSSQAFYGRGFTMQTILKELERVEYPVVWEITVE